MRTPPMPIRGPPSAWGCGAAACQSSLAACCSSPAYGACGATWTWSCGACGGALRLKQIVLRTLARSAHTDDRGLDAGALDAQLVVALVELGLERRGVVRVDRAGLVVGLLRLAVDLAHDRQLLRGVGLVGHGDADRSGSELHGGDRD